MAEAFFNYLVKNKTSATSAGTKPSAHINPVVVEVMLEAGVDISKWKDTSRLMAYPFARKILMLWN